MNSNEKQAKETIQTAILLLDKIPSLRLNSYAMTLFFNAKTDEIAVIFAGGVMVDTKILKETLQKLAPTQGAKWGEIK